jgi:uncharacterized protein (TIGR03435 family)
MWDSWKLTVREETRQMLGIYFEEGFPMSLEAPATAVKSRSVASLLLAAMGLGVCAAQTGAGPAGHAFEVATVRPADRSDGRHFYGMRLLPSGRFQVSGESLKAMVWNAYVGAQTRGQVDGGPKWAETDQFDLEAKVDEADMADWEKLSDAQRVERVMPMLRTLLEQRFQLKVHTETRVTPVYAVVQAKGGVKMKEEDARIRGKGGQDKAPTGGFMMSDKGWVGSAVQIRGLLGQIAYEEGRTDRLMVDETGLTGYYDFTVKLSRDKDGPSAEQQIEEQMGLKVEERKLPIETYVIDGAERPAEN